MMQLSINSVCRKNKDLQLSTDGLRTSVEDKTTEGQLDVLGSISEGNRNVRVFVNCTYSFLFPSFAGWSCQVLMTHAEDVLISCWNKVDLLKMFSCRHLEEKLAVFCV